MTVDPRRGPRLEPPRPPLLLRRRPPGVRPARFRALALGGPDDIGRLARLRRPLDPIAAPGPIRAVAGAPGHAPPPHGLAALALLGASAPLSLRMPEALVSALAGPPRAHPGARLLALEAALDALMEVVDRRLGAPVALAPEPADAPREHWRAFDLDLAEGAGAGRHRVFLGTDRAGLGALARALEPWPGRARRPAIRLAASVEVGRFEAPRARLARLAARDTILPGAGALSLAAGRLVLQDRAVARLRIDGRTAILEETPAMTADEPDEAEAAPLGDLPVRLTFRLAARDMTLDEIADLRAGSVIALDAEAEDPQVDLCVGGRVVGRGEVVSVGGRLGVHVLRVAGLG